MKNTRKNTKKKNQGQRQVLDVSGFAQRIGIPIPRLPFLIGSTGDLSPSTSLYPKRVNLDVPIALQIVSVVAGVCTSVVAINNGIMTNFNAKFGNVFNEYSIVGLILEIRVGSVSAPSGLAYAYISETSSAAATLNEGSELPHIDLDIVVPSGNKEEVHLLKWKPTNLLDLDWTAVGTTVTPLWLKFFTSVAGTGTLVGTAAQILITGSMALSFRGYAPA